MPGWADDPELLATFRAEVEERVASLQSGLLALEEHPSPRQVVAGLFRDAHTVKGSARMLGLSDVLAVAHRAEDLLGALRDGRLPVRRDVVNLLLASCDGILGAMPGVEEPVPSDHLAALASAMERATEGEDPVEVPHWAPHGTDDDEPVEEAPRRGVDSVRVTATKVYELIDVVGEAELDSRRLEQTSNTIDAIVGDTSHWLRELRDALAHLDTGTDAHQAMMRLVAAHDQMIAASRDLHELADDAQGRLAQVRDGAMGLAMVPVRRVVAGLPRVVRDLATESGKDVRLVLLGQEVELDKQVLDGVSDALKHLVVNAVDHGCEASSERVASGKPAHSTVTVTARAAGGTVVIEVADDGSGIDENGLRTAAIARGLLAPDSTVSGSALYDLLFLPGFTTSSEITEASGRGIGLDVVRTAVEDVGGLVELRSSAGAGTTFSLTLPVTLGVLRCLIARIGDEQFALPVPGIVESLSLKNAVVHSLAGSPVVVRHGETLPLLDLGRALGIESNDASPQAAVVVRQGDRQVAWAVEALDGERELVVKDLGAFLGRPPIISGATIDGSGSVVCLVDLRELTLDSSQPAATYSALVPTADPTEPLVRRARVLVVEDSVGVRELERAILEAAGYDVTTAVDGSDGAARLGEEPADLVLSDVEMPGMDGYDLTRTIRRTRGWEHVPVVIMTSRVSEEDQRAGLEAGASAYLLKTEFDQEQLVETVRRLVGR
ncbi:MAG TPA: response regulator [Mycobacteriales bacterium]|nr:response regulator [Mycobacteriales bacterium]